MALTYDQVLNGMPQGYEGGAPAYNKALVDTFKNYNVDPYVFGYGGNVGYGGGALVHATQGGAQKQTQARNSLLLAMLADQQKQQAAPEPEPKPAGRLVGKPDNMNPLPQGTNSGYKPPANATNPAKGVSWQAGGQLEELPNKSPFGESWGGGEGTTYSPITMNQQAALLSANYQAPNQWMNGLLYNSPWETYYG